MERDFISILADLDEGNVNTQLSDLLAEITRAVLETSLPGAISVTLSLKKQGGMIIITPKVSSKKPAPATDATLFYADDQGNLSRNDVRQMELKHLAAQPSELRVVPPASSNADPKGA